MKLSNLSDPGDSTHIENSTTTYTVMCIDKYTRSYPGLAAINIELAMVSVPANMTHFFQPLDLIVNREAKKQPRPQGAFPWLWVGRVKSHPKPGKSALGTRFAKKFMRDQSTAWYSVQIQT